MWFHTRWVVGIEADAWWCGSEQISVDCMAGSRCDMTGVQWCNGNFSLVGTLTWHYGHIHYHYRGGGGGA